MTTYLIRDEREQSLRFYQGYDPFFIVNKARLLMFVSDAWEEFLGFAQARDAEFGPDPATTRRALRAQIRFAEYQQFEACFALMLAPFQPLPHWLYLTTYRTGDLLKAAQEFVNGDAKSLTVGRCSAVGDFVDVAIYGGQKPSDPELQKQWPENLERTHWMLGTICKRYIKAAAYGGEYNAYKHGLRVLTGKSQIEISTKADLSDAVVLAQSEDTVAFLELEPADNGQKRVVEVVRHFNPLESYQFIEFMGVLGNNMKRCRLAVLTGAPEVQLSLFTGLDKQALIKLSKFFECRMK